MVEAGAPVSAPTLPPPPSPSRRADDGLPPLNAADARGSVLDRVQAVVAARPDALAVTDEHERVTYAGLAGRAAAVAGRLRAAGGKGEPVAVLQGHDVGAVVSVLAVLAAGSPVVVLDPTTPIPRLRDFLDIAGARRCLTDGSNAPLARRLVGDVLVVGDETGDPGDLAAGPAVDAGAPAVIVFTSGTTGRPKGVVMPHGALLHDCWLNAVATGCYGEGDPLAHTLPMAFSAGLFATVAGIVVGATEHLYDPRARGVAGLPDWLDAVGATVVQASPAVLRRLLGVLPEGRVLPSLRSLTIAGEPAHARDVEAVRRHLSPACVIRNRYGSSETGLIAEYAVPADRELAAGALPVGTPLPDREVTLLDADGAPVPPGEVGTVVVTSRTTALGYWRDPERTAAAFSTGPDGRVSYRTSDLARLTPAGELQLVGRRDHSLKVRGYLVEPGEVEAALMDGPDVVEAVVTGAADESTGRVRLVAHLVSSAERPSAAAVRTRLRARLPLYMVPDTVVFLPALPRGERGKVDRAALPPVPAPAHGAEPPRGDWERALAELWGELLGVQGVGRDDDFFELGGDSVVAEELMVRLVRELGVAESDALTSVLLAAPTVRTFAARLLRRPPCDSDTAVPLRGGPGTPLFFVAGAGGLAVGASPLVRRLPSGIPVHGLQGRGLERRAWPDWSVEGQARRHLRSVREVQPHGPYRLAGYSGGALVALWLAHALRDAGEEVELVALLDSFPPDPRLVPRPAPLSPRWAKERVRRAVSLTQLGLTAVGVLPAQGQAHYGRMHLHMRLRARRFRCPPWPGRALVVVAEDDDHAEYRAAWSDAHLTGPWTLRRIAGSHLGLLREPHVAAVAAALAEALEATPSGTVGSVARAPVPAGR